MISKFKSRVLSIFLTAIVVVSVFSVGQIFSNAAEQAITVTIADVLYRYKDSKTILDLINTYRNQNDISSVTMDENLMKKAMTRAAELSVYASVTRPDGSNYVDNCSQLIGYDVMSNSSILNQWKSSANSNTIMLSSSYRSVGVGVVDVNGYKYVCVLLSTNSSSGVDNSVLSQSNKTVNQTIQALPSVLSNIQTAFSNGTSLMCGSSLQAYLYVTNKLYPIVGAFLTADNMNVTIDNTKCFSYTYNKINAIYPGESLITITSKQNSSITASATIKAVSLSLDGCSFAAIPDQYYTGKAVSPAVSGKDSSGNTLILGTDYTLEYSNNIKPGVATVTVNGMGKYAGQTKKINFNIVINQDQAFSITVKVSPESILLGDSTTISVSQSGGTAPVKYTYDYTVSGSSNWKSLVSSTTKTNYVFKPNEAKSYNVKVTAVDSTGRTASQTAYVKVEAKMVCNVLLNKTTFTIGEKVSITASQQGGKSPTYSFSIKTPSASWKTLKDFSDVSYCDYIPIESGEHTVLVKFKSTTGQSEEVYKTFNVTGTALKNTSSISATSITLGSTVTAKGSATGGTGTYQYQMVYKKTSDTVWITAQAYKANATVTFKPAKATTYDVCIKVKDSAGTEVKKFFTVTVKENTTVLQNNSTLSSASIILGNTVTAKCAAKGGTGSYQYQIVYKKVSDTAWTTIQAYKANSTVTFKPAKATTYDVCIKVKDSAGTEVKKFFTVTVKAALANKSTLSSTSIVLGSTVTAKGSATGGTGTYQYQMAYKKTSDTTWVTIQTYNANSTVTFKPAKATTYDVCIKVKDSAGTIEKKYFTVTVKAALANKSTLSSTSIVLGSTVTAKGSATGGTGTYQYQMAYKKTSDTTWVTIQTYNANSTVTFKPAKATTYDVCIKVKDSAGTIEKKYFTVTVKAALANKSTLSSTSIVLGSTVTAKGSATGGTGTYQYQMVYKKTSDTTWTTIQTYNANSTVTFKPAKATTYDVCIKVKDSAGTEVKKFFTVTVKN